ncbi:MAG: glycerol kinase GlpK [Rhodoluna sp.]|nr:glycerol kinase GlpK [Rhodoluna sp.]
MAILAIDAGTTGITTVVVAHDGSVVSQGYQEFEQHYPQPGWVEHLPDQIWAATLASVKQALEKSNEKPTAIGITNQRETLVLWDKTTLQSPRPAIVWQDRRSVELNLDGERVKQLTGLPLDPYFTSSKLVWIRQNEPQIWAGVEQGRTAVGTIDSYLIARISGGRHHITDASNASRTQLYSLESGDWSDELLAMFEVPRVALPRIVSSYGNLAETMPEAFLGLDLPITGIAGDQQAALFGQCAFEPGDAKCTYGTGAFLLKNTGSELQIVPQLLSTVAWQHPNGKRQYALEGSTFVAGAAVQWLRDGLGIIQDAKEIESLAAETSDGVIFIPALTGLGAPFWKPEARGELLGLTRGSNKHHIARATLEGIAMQVFCVFDLMGDLNRLRVDGGASSNDLLMQIQSDLLQTTVERPTHLEATAIGAAYLAGLGSGFWQSQEELQNLNPVRATFNPGVKDTDLIERWVQAAKAI